MSAGKVSFGFTIPQRGVFFGIATWPEMIAMAAKADQIPLFDSVWVGDSVMAKPRPESIVLLGALAAATSRVKLGVGCMASFPIRDPIGLISIRSRSCRRFSGRRSRLSG